MPQLALVVVSLIDLWRYGVRNDSPQRVRRGRQTWYEIVLYVILARAT